MPPPYNIEVWRRTPIWIPSYIHINIQAAHYKTVGSTMLQTYRIHTLFNVTNSLGIPCPWAEGLIMIYSLRLKIAYEKLLVNLVPSPLMHQGQQDSGLVHYEHTDNRGTMIREYNCSKSNQGFNMLGGQFSSLPTHQHLLSNGLLKLTERATPTFDSPLRRVLIKKSSIVNQVHWQVMALQDSNSFLAIHFPWKDGKDFFETSTTHVRKVLSNQPLPQHMSITKWIYRYG